MQPTNALNTSTPTETEQSQAMMIIPLPFAAPQSKLILPASMTQSEWRSMASILKAYKPSIVAEEGDNTEPSPSDDDNEFGENDAGDSG